MISIWRQVFHTPTDVASQTDSPVQQKWKQDEKWDLLQQAPDVLWALNRAGCICCKSRSLSGAFRYCAIRRRRADPALVQRRWCFWSHLKHKQDSSWAWDSQKKNPAGVAEILKSSAATLLWLKLFDLFFETHTLWVKLLTNCEMFSFLYRHGQGMRMLAWRKNKSHPLTLIYWVRVCFCFVLSLWDFSWLLFEPLLNIQAVWLQPVRVTLVSFLMLSERGFSR